MIFPILLFALVLSACSFTGTQHRIEAEQALEIAQKECGRCGAPSIESEGDRYLIHFEEIRSSNGPMLGGGGGTVIIDAYSGEIVRKVFLE